MRTLRQAFWSAAAFAVIAAPLAIQAAPAPAGTAPAQREAVQNTPPRDLADDAYITLSGTVEGVPESDSFRLRYKSGVITVDTQDAWPGLFRKDAIEVLKPGDRVTVTGRIEDPFFASKQINAISVATGGRTYWNMPYNANQQGYWPYYGWDDRRYDDMISLAGTVSKVTGDDELELKYGNSSLKVDISELDISDTANLRVGDHVRIYGIMDDNWFTERELDAYSLVRTDVYDRNARNNNQRNNNQRNDNQTRR